MPIKPLNTEGEAFSVVVDVDHAVTSLFTLPQGCFYSVEALVLNPVTGIPLRPVVDYRFYQQEINISKTTGKQVAAIIHLVNKSITKVTVTAKYTHGIEQSQIDNWNRICLDYKNVPGWMNWLGQLDAPFQQHPSMQRRFTKTAHDYTFVDYQLQFNYLAKQILDGDDNVLSHIGYWQNYLFSLPTSRLNQAVTDMTNFLNKMKSETGLLVGDFKFSDNDGRYIPTRNQFFNTLLVDRGLDTVGGYTYLPEGSAVPSKKTNLYQKVNAKETVVGTITLNKTEYVYKDTMTAKVKFTSIGVPATSLSTKFTLQVIDTTLPEGSNLVYQSPLTGNIQLNLEYTFNINLKSLTNEKGNVARYLVRVPEHGALQPVLVNCIPDMKNIPGSIAVEMTALNNVGQVTSGGFVDAISVSFKEIGRLTSNTNLYIHIKGDFPDSAIDTTQGNYPKFQTWPFRPGFDYMKDQTIIRFTKTLDLNKNFYANIIVSKSSDPNNTTDVIAQNIWYITNVPVNPYVNWYFTKKVANVYERITTINEGNDIYLVGKLSVGRTVFPFTPTLSVVSNGISSAVNGIDFNIDNTLIVIDEFTVAYKINLPLKPELESKYKFLSIKSANSNTALVWIVDVSMQADLTGSWRSGPGSKSSVLDYTTETSDFYLHLESNVLSDGTTVNVVVEAPTLYGSTLTYPASIAMFGGRAVIQFKLDAPLSANVDQYMKVKIYAPGREYNAPPLLIVDSNKPYYEIQFLVNGTEADTAYEGDKIECRVRCIAGLGAVTRAAVSLSGSADSTTGPNSDFTYPAGSGALLRFFNADTRTWINALLDNVGIKNNLNEAYKTLTLNVEWPTLSGLKMGKDTSKTLNIRKKGT